MAVAEAVASGTTASELLRKALQAYLGKAGSGKRAAPAGVESETAPPSAGRQTVRVTLGPRERAALERGRVAGGFASIAHYVRAILRAHTRGNSELPTRQVLDQLAVTNTHLAKLGGNLNQIARALNVDLKRGKEPGNNPQLSGLGFLRERITEQLERQHKLMERYETRRR